jgi:hypothetical protein
MEFFLPFSCEPKGHTGINPQESQSSKIPLFPLQSKGPLNAYDFSGVICVIDILFYLGKVQFWGKERENEKRTQRMYAILGPCLDCQKYLKNFV